MSVRRIANLILLVASLPAPAASPGARPFALPEAAAPAPAPLRLAWALRPGVLERLSPGARQAVLAANGLAPAPARTGAPSPQARAAGPTALSATSGLAASAPLQNVRVNDPALDVDHHMNRTTSVAARGPLVFVGFEDTRNAASGYGVSNDGGTTFTHSRIQPPADTSYYGSPSVAIGPAGEVYYAFLEAENGSPTDVVLAKSTDGGQTFPVSGLAYPTALVQDGNEVMDQPAVTVDNGASSPRKGTVYVAWTYYSALDGFVAILCAHASDGVTFQQPAVLSVIDGRIVGHPAVAVAPNGDVYVAYEDGHLSPEGISITRSTDGGNNWGQLHTVATFQPAGPLSAGGGGASSNPGPSLAVDGNGVVHVAWAAVSTGATAVRPSGRASGSRTATPSGGRPRTASPWTATRRTTASRPTAAIST